MEAGMDRRSFVRTLGIAGAVAACTPGFAFELLGEPDEAFAAGTFGINSKGVVYGGPMVLAPEGDGGTALLRNLKPVAIDGGVNFGFDGVDYTYRDLENPRSWTKSGATHFSGKIPGSSATYSQTITPIAGGAKVSVKFSGSPKLSYASWGIQLPTTVFGGTRYRTGTKVHTYPRTYTGGSDNLIRDGFTRFDFDADHPTKAFRVSGASGLSLYDMRLWTDSMFSLEVTIPSSGHTTFTITKPPKDPGPMKPALRFSRAGYLSRGPKFAVLEIDWRGKWPSRDVRLQHFRDGRWVTSRTGTFKLAGKRWWRQFARFDFGDVTTPGTYRLHWAGGTSPTFAIAGSTFAGRWKPTLDSFLPFQMCHVAVDLGDGIRSHAACHLDDGIQAPPHTSHPDEFTSYEANEAPGAGSAIPCAVGGWHDAGDFDLNVSAQGFSVHKLALAWERFAPARDVNALDRAAKVMHIGTGNGTPDLLEQVEWGARWLLAMWRPDGRVNVGVIEQPAAYGGDALPEEITDGIVGTGDERWVFTDMHSDVLLKFVVSACACSRALSASDSALAAQLLASAKTTWTYFRTHAEVYRQTVYFYPDMTGRDQMVLCAAAELYLTEPSADLLTYLGTFANFLNAFPTEWPQPEVSTHDSYWYAPPFLARLIPHLSDGALKTAAINAVRTASSALAEKLRLRPFPMDEWDAGEWGSNGTFLGRVYDAYWMSTVSGAHVTFNDALPSAYLIFGLHPASDMTMCTGQGLSEPKYVYSGTLLKKLGDTPASIPGAVVPGISSWNAGDVQGLLSYRDWPHEYRNGEACIYDAAMWVFVGLALEDADHTVA